MQLRQSWGGGRDGTPSLAKLICQVSTLTPSYDAPEATRGEFAAVARNTRKSILGTSKASSRRGETLVSFDIPAELKAKVRQLAEESNLSLAEYIRGIMVLTVKEQVRLKIDFKRIEAGE